MAGWGFSSDSIITSPNRPWIPRFAIAHSEITTYTDGRWGYHEYSRWPQAFDHAHIHCACIPRSTSLLATGHDVLWRTLNESDWVDKDCPIVRLGRLEPQLLRELDGAAESVISSVQRCACVRTSHQRIRDFLVICLHQCLDRLRLLPAEKTVIIALAAHVQRLTLELCGLRVFLTIAHARIESQLDCRTQVLDVVGALTHDPSVAQTLHRVGIPVWFQQRYSPQIVFWHTGRAVELPAEFSTTPSYPRLVLAVRDLSGALNTPGESMRAMAATVRRQLLASHLPSLPAVPEDTQPGPTPKKVRVEPGSVDKQPSLQTQWPNKWDSTLGHARPVLIMRDERDARTLGHGLDPIGPARQTSHRRTRGALARPPQGSSTFTMNPFRQHYPSSDLFLSPAWSTALLAASPLPQPRSSVRYFFAPPWMIDVLVGHDTPHDKRVRYLHNMLSIRLFCRVRLFDRSIAGRPLTVQEWRDALWGDYARDPSSAERSEQPKRHRVQQSIRELFGKGADLPSYDPKALVTLDGARFTADDVAHNVALRKRLVWEAHEANWCCDLLSLDAVMTGSMEWDEMKRWVREAHVSEVWGLARSGLNICPDAGDGLDLYCWQVSTEEGWERCRRPLRAFVELLVTWPGCPSSLFGVAATLDSCPASEFDRVQHVVLAYYVSAFVEKFQRLPVPPVRSPLVDEVLRGDTSPPKDP